MGYINRIELRLALFTTLFLGIFLPSCSTLSLTYHYAGWLLHWKIDHYIDITSNQKAILQSNLTTLQRWHKKEELPRYIHFLNDVKTKLHDGLKSHEIETIFENYTSLWKRLGRRITKKGVPILISMNNAQIQNLEKTMQEENQEIFDRVKSNAKKLMQKRVEKVLENLEDWLGSLTPSQKLRIEELVRAFPNTTQAWIDNRIRRQRSFIQLLKSPTLPLNLEQRIHDLFVAPEKGASPSYLSAVQKREAALVPTVLALDRLITFQQRNHLTKKLDSLIQELKDITQ